ncbi:MAG TPA: hypothetical protein VIS05_01270 [Ilumatobacter sp.]
MTDDTTGPRWEAPGTTDTRSHRRLPASPVARAAAIAVVVAMAASVSVLLLGGAAMVRRDDPQPGPATPASPVNEPSTPAGPRVPPCGTFDLAGAEIIAGLEFPAGTYLIHAFGIPCDDVIGADGVFGRFVDLADDEPLPAPWRHLDGAVGAPKFVTGPAQGFRVQRIAP